MSERGQTQVNTVGSADPAWYAPLRNAMTWVGSHETTLLVAIILIAGGIWGFIALAEAVGEGALQSLDDQILLSMRNPNDLADPIGPLWLEEMGRDFTALGGTGVLLLITILVSGYLLLRRKYRALWLMLISVGGAWGVSLVLKAFFARPRPTIVPHGTVIYNASFPSGHAMISTAFYLTLGVLLARIHPSRRVKGYLLVAAMIISLVVGLSRLYLGVHWPTDVLAGWTLGGVWALLSWTIIGRLQRKGKVESDMPEPEEGTI